MTKQFTTEDDELLSELGVEVEKKKVVTRTPKEERIIAGFEEIQRFVEEQGHTPRHGEEYDIFERIYAVRLDRIREQTECWELLEDLDHQELLAGGTVQKTKIPDEIDDDELLVELGVESETSDITELKHVRSTVEKQAADEIANRERCEDFEKFKPLFDKVREELDQGIRISRIIRKEAGFLKTYIKEGEYFILGGLTVYIAHVGEATKAPNGDADARLRIIYSNGTQSKMLLRSLQRSIYKDETSRRISEPSVGPLFSSETEEDDLASGTIYVLRSKSDLPAVVEHREILHKIGVTGGKVEKRIANAKIDPTFLMADVEIVATYELYNINRSKLENIIHRVFQSARLDIEVIDRFGSPVVPREWFLVPLFVIDEAVGKIKNGSIAGCSYDTNKAKLVSGKVSSPVDTRRAVEEH